MACLQKQHFMLELQSCLGFKPLTLNALRFREMIRVVERDFLVKKAEMQFPPNVG